MALQRLKEAAEKAKIELSSAQQTEIDDRIGRQVFVHARHDIRFETICSFEVEGLSGRVFFAE